MADDVTNREPEDPELIAAAAIRRWGRRLDVAIVILLGAASFLAAWAGYQAGIWGGKKVDATVRSEELRAAATRSSIIGYQDRQVDIALFLGWLEADSRGDTRLAEFYEERFTSRLTPAFAAWIATDPLRSPDAPRDPFGLPEYQVPGLQEAAAFDQQATELSMHAQWYDEQSETYIFFTLLLAVVLFFGGISTKIGWRPAQVAILAAAWVLFCFCLVRVATMPGLDDPPEVSVDESRGMLAGTPATAMP